MQPAVSRLEDQLGDQAAVLRVSIHSETGAALRERYQFEAAPLFIIFDAEGNIIRRSGSVPEVEQIIER